jgi:hypothetical protein
MSEEMVQPEVIGETEGQGQAPYAEYLDKLPEDIRGDVEPVFKDWDANVTKRFQEAAEFRKQWEPFQDLGLTDVPRDELENLIALRELAANDPEQFDSWLAETARERGLIEGFEDSDDPYGEQEDPLNPVMSELSELKAWKEQMEQEQRISEAMKVVDQQVSEAAAKHPDVPQELAEQFLASFAESDPQNAVSLAFEAAEKWMAQIQQGMVSDKLSQPEAAEQGQRSDSSPEQITSFAQASQAALQRLKNQ